MAKTRTFSDKMKKKGKEEAYRQMVKLVTPEKNPETGVWKFRTRMVVVTDENKKEIFG